MCKQLNVDTCISVNRTVKRAGGIGGMNERQNRDKEEEWKRIE